MPDLYAGIDLGGTSIHGALSDGDGNVLTRDVTPTNSHVGPLAVLDRVESLLRALCATVHEGPASLRGIGIGLPGLVDQQNGIAKFMPNLPTQWRDVPVAEYLCDRLCCPVAIMNDVRMATLGELKYGRGRDQPTATLAFFSIGTGIGGGLALDGKLHLGPLGAAGELGHQTLQPNGARCGCGNRGCLETLASGPAIAASGIRLMTSGLAPTLHEAAAGDASRVTPALMAAAAEHDELIREALEDAFTWIGIAAANVVSVVHAQQVILGGGVSEIGDPLVTKVKQVIDDRIGMFPTDDVRVSQSALGDRAGVMGAIALAVTNASKH
ncbi:MAG: ROK family protein [Rubripirellula sp.]